VQNNDVSIYYSDWLELIKYHLAIKVFWNVAGNIDKIKNQSIS